MSLIIDTVASSIDCIILINITHVCLKDFATFTDNTKYIKKEASGCNKNKTFYFLI